MELKDLNPRPTTFKITHGDKKRELTLRPFSLADNAWMEENWTAEERLEKFQSLDKKFYAEIGYHQLDVDSKKYIHESVKIRDYDPEKGEEVDIECTGPEKLMHLIVGPENTIELINAILTALGVSQPLVDEIADQDSKQKKKPKSR